MRVEVVLAEGLVVGPKDRLVLRFDKNFPMSEENVLDLQRTLNEMGLGDRALVIFGEADFEMVKIEGVG